MSKIPVAGRDGERHGVDYSFRLLLFNVVQLFQNGEKDLSVVRLSPATPAPGCSQAKSDTTKTMLTHEAKEIAAEELPVRGRADPTMLLKNGCMAVSLSLKVQPPRPRWPVSLRYAS